MQVGYIYLVQPACEIDNNFSSSVVINDLKLTNITCKAQMTKTIKLNMLLMRIIIIHIKLNTSGCF